MWLYQIGEPPMTQTQSHRFSMSVYEGRLCEKAGLPVQIIDTEDGRFHAVVNAPEAQIATALGWAEA